MVQSLAGDGRSRVERAAELVTGRLASWLGVVVWTGVVLVSLFFATKVGSIETSRLTEFLPSGAPSTKALELDRSFPSGRELQAEVVFYRAGGLAPRDLALAGEDTKHLVSKLENKIGATSSLVRSPDGDAAVLTVPVRGNEVAVQDTIERIRSVIGDGTGGLEIRVTGEAAIQADLIGAFSGADNLLLFATAALVAVLLAATYRSPILWLVPLVCVAIAEAVAQAVVYGVGRAGLTINGQSGALVTVIVFGAGTDYALLLTARYREELRRHQDHRHAMAVAWRRAAPAIVASALTVTATLACLLPAQLNITTDFGVVGMIGILSAAVVILGAYPALLLVMGRRVFWPAVPRHAPDFVHRGIWAALARVVSRGRRPVWISGFVLLAGAGIGIVTVNTNVSSLSELPPSAPSVQGYDLLVKTFPRGEVAPVDVVVTDRHYLSAVRHAFVHSTVVSALGPAEFAGNMAHFELVLAVTPTGSTGFAAIRELRSDAEAAGGHVVVGGQTAEDLDTATASHRDTFLIVPLVLAVVLLVLLVVLRALLGPLLVILTVVVSFGAALGVASAAVVPLLNLPGIDPTVPLLTFVFLVAFGTDYNIFLLTRMREEVVRRGFAEGVSTSVASTGGVLTSAGIILAGTFSVLAVLPIVASREIGIVVAVGVLADTFLVRTILVPTLAADLRSRFWWPTRPEISPEPSETTAAAREESAARERGGRTDHDQSGERHGAPESSALESRAHDGSSEHEQH